ncbi:hypothetical protein GF325_10910 [Candidatus Bathyarchaeota archaeon]|nr:hypothetical protein [Candidatus Bathyarchaeota archaeon]
MNSNQLIRGSGDFKETVVLSVPVDALADIRWGNLRFHFNPSHRAHQIPPLLFRAW